MTKFKIKPLIDSPVATLGKEYLAVDNGNEFMFHGDNGKVYSMPWSALLGEDPRFSVVEGLEELAFAGGLGKIMDGYIIIGTNEMGDVEHKSAKKILMTRNNLQYLYANLSERQALTEIQDQLHEEGYPMVYITEIKEFTYMVPAHERDEENNLIASSAQKINTRLDSDIYFTQKKYFFDVEEPVDVIHDENYRVSFKPRGKDSPEFVFKTKKQRDENKRGLWEIMKHCSDQGKALYFKRPKYGFSVDYDELEGANDPHEAYMTSEDQVIVKLADGTERVIGKSGELDVGWQFLGNKEEF